ncbi:proton-coupled folate transporter-like isoform X1 [Diorhabda sublineata]|uniref:proton-coupled folate transporter-like isoform X1 n=2 Tax=Diorhabda sublineata TaxID=1163346 RepID=UPI0024E064BD|nr:proton-coupled folate transporter-like isoform X1 [Diorhabda sublineata]XP_056639059.1 proton-coupled folate transporter-like isoform X1 [Diorhabda sublineata]
MALFKKITVEIPLFFCFVNFLLTSSVLTNLIVYRTCYILLEFNRTRCAELGNHVNQDTEHLEKLVEPTADIIIMIKSLVESLFPIFVCMFAGPWSDKHGRKPILLMTLIGMTCGSILMIVFSFFEYLSPWYVLFTSVPSMLTGSSTTYFAVTLSYLSDISTDETRAMRMVSYEVALACGVLIGSVSSSYIFYASNYQTIFGIGSCCMIISCLYVFFFIPESLESKKLNSQDSTTEVESRRVRLVYIADVIRTAFKKRENYERALIILSIASIIIITFATGGDYSIQFIFLRGKLNWNLRKYTLFSSAYHACWVIGTMCGTFILQKKLKIREFVLALVGLSSLLSCVILQLFATSDIFIYIGGVTKCLGGMVAPMLRSQVSRLVSVDEAGKIFSITVAGGALISLGASPLYTAIYNATINIDAALFNILTIVLIGAAIVLVLIAIILENISNSSTQQNETHTIIENETDSENSTQ